MTFFRRTDFPMAPNRKPLWHVFESNQSVIIVKKSETGLMDRQVQGIQTRALCGYEYAWQPVFHAANGPFFWKDEVKTAKLVCAKCRKAAEKIREDAVAAGELPLGKEARDD